MVRLRPSGIGFWLFLLLLALGAGWAANQTWRLPFMALFDGQDSPVEEAEAEVVAERSAPDEASAEEATTEAAVEQSTIEQPEVEPSALAESSPEQAAAEPSAPSSPTTGSEAQSDAMAGDAREAEPGPEQAAGGSTRESAQETKQQETAQQLAEPAVTETEAERGVQPADVDVAALEPSGSEPGAPGSGTLPEPDPDEAARDAPDAAPSEEDQVDPSFDIVRVEPDGRAVIAGRAAPGAEVEVRSGDEVIDRVRASRRGEWVAMPSKPLSPGDQELSAVAALKGAPPVESAQVVVIAVPKPTTASSTAVSAKQPEEVSTPAQPVAVLVPRDGKGSGRILQAPGRLSAEGTLALMTVSYDEAGELLLSGEAPPGVPVRIYVDNRPAALVVGDAKGAWSSGLDEPLEPGTYTLRLDQLDAEGKAVARIETPFTRVSEPPVAGQLQVDYVVVQPGNSLWRIARRLSGKGLDYVYIYDANQAQIRNPDLIYPGQVFEIPPEYGSAG